MVETIALLLYEISICAYKYSVHVSRVYESWKDEIWCYSYIKEDSKSGEDLKNQAHCKRDG